MPDWRKEIRQRLAGLRLEPTREAEIVEEMAQHLDDRYAEMLAAGATDEAAHGAALAELNEHEMLQRGLRRVERQVRQEAVVLGAHGRSNMIADLWQDLRYGARMLRRSSGFTVVAVLSLAIGIGANTAIFSVIDALMLKTLPVQNPEQLVTLRTNDSGFYSSYPSFERYSDLTQVFSNASAICLVDRYNVTTNSPIGAAAPQVGIALVSGNYFSTLGVDTVIGRTLTADDDRLPGGHPVAVISYGYWEGRFERVADVVGRTLTLNNTTYTILGVTPRGFSGDWIGQPTDVWIPIAMQSQVMPEKPGLLTNPSANWVRIVARLKPNVTIPQAQAAAQVSYQQILREKAGPNPPYEELQQIAQAQLGLDSAARGFSLQRQSMAQPLVIVMIVVGLVLLITCANLATLLLARAAARQQELAVRRALGASRSRLVRQLLTESFLLVLIGGALGVLLAAWGTNALATFLGSGLPRMGFSTPVTVSLNLHLDARMLAFTAAVCLITGLLFGLVPAFRASQVALASALNRRGADSGAARFSLGKGLVILQVALSLLLLSSAGLFVRTLRNLKSQDIGIDRQHLLLVWTAPFQAGRSGPAIATLYQTAQERISSLPGVLAASPSNSGWLTGGGRGSGSEGLTVEGQAPKPGLAGGIGRAAVGPGFLATVGMQLLEGRDFTEQDNKDAAPHVAIINETLARFEFGDQNPVGKRFGQRGETGYPWEIVGVVKDGKDRNLREQNLGMVYVPYRQLTDKLGMMCLAVHTVGNPADIAARVRQELSDIDPSLPVLNIDTVEEQLDGVLVQERLTATLASIFGVLAALLACLGLYGVIAYTVARRTNEIGIRLALGAPPAGVLRMILKESMVLVLVGVVIGISLTLAVTRLISAMLFGVSATDPLTIGATTLLLIMVAALASLLPARRAARVDPMVALRYE
jgi:predicted permease